MFTRCQLLSWWYLSRQHVYVLVTFVHIRNISAVTGPILTKLFGPIIVVDQNVLGQNFYRSKFFSHPKFFKTQKFFQSQNFFGPKSFSTQNCFRPKFFPDTKLFSALFSDSIFSWDFWDFRWKRGIKPFQAEHYRLKSCCLFSCLGLS